MKCFSFFHKYFRGCLDAFFEGIGYLHEKCDACYCLKCYARKVENCKILQFSSVLVSFINITKVCLDAFFEGIGYLES